MDHVLGVKVIANIKTLNVNKNPIYQKILNFLETQPCPRSTNYIAGEGIWPDQYFHKFENAIVIPGKNAVNRAYYYLKRLENQGKVKQVYKGAWMLTDYMKIK